ncbi:FAD-dependent oxidoreductase [Aquabacterium sp.]|uniref:FAD-dependent oxidoreductase n=1 Tax=Aquabacterium sp. TaxID=1872578 RepID=UPI003784FF23
MTLQQLRICVVGAGIAGLACALAAAGQGHAVQLVDEAALPRQLPASIDVVPGMLRDLAALGVADDCVRAGFAYHGIEVIDRQGRRLFELPTERLAGPRLPAAVGIAHGDLHALLAQAAVRCGAELLRGQRVDAIEAVGDRARVVLGGERRLEADIVLLATGARSPLRAAIFPAARPVAPLGQAWHYALVQRPPRLDRPLVAMGGPGHRAIVLPVQHGTAGIAVTEPTPLQGELPAPTQLRRALQAFAPPVAALAAHLRDDTPVATRPVLSGVLDSPWHSGPVLAVGDGAHALPPHFGQAAAQSVEDARVLADLLATATERDALFRAFEQRRSARARQVHEMASTAAHWDLRPDGTADLGQLMQRLMRTLAQPA